MFFWNVHAKLLASYDQQYHRGLNAIKSMAGCYLVDYNYLEVKALAPGYIRNAEIYDPNKKGSSIKEWIYVEEFSSSKLRLQHILFAADKEGKVIKESLLKHQAEDWEYLAPFIYDFTKPRNWTPVQLTGPGLSWTRRITNLDDGLRYQCASDWKETTAFPEWKCDNYAPIPGRETRDMGRKDYHALKRSTLLTAYGHSWLERQDNIKVIHPDTGPTTDLATEAGKNWYVRLPDSECNKAQDFAAQGKMFGDILRRTWESVLTGEENFVEKLMPEKTIPRFAKMMMLEEKYKQRDLNDPQVQKQASLDILEIIEEYRQR